MRDEGVPSLAPGELKALQQRAMRNDAEACYTLAQYYAGGKEKNMSKSNRFMEKAAALEHPAALFAAASKRLCCGNPHARKGAFRLLQRAAELGVADAMNNLGNCYIAGLGCEADEELARVWHRKAADSGSPAGMFNVGVYYSRQFEISGERKAMASALLWLRQAAERGLKEAQLELYRLLQDYGRSPEEAQESFRWCLAASQQGDLEAMYDLALMYRKGFGVEKDWGKMAHWFLKSAQGGLAHSQFNLGIAYLNGEGLEKDVETGVMWLKESAAQKDIMAIKALYTIYGCSEYGHENPKESFRLLRLAAEMGDEESLSTLKNFIRMARDETHKMVDDFFPDFD